MNNLLTLIKIEVGRTFSNLFLNRKNNKRRASSLVYVFGLVGILIVAMIAFYSFLFNKIYLDNNLSPAPTIVMFASLASILTFMSTIGQARGIYVGDDYDLLTTLPIRKRDIIISKISVLFLLELSFSCLVLLPHAVVLGIMSKDISLALITVLVALFTPIVPITIGCLLSLGLTMLTARFKFGNMISTILYTIFVIAIVIGGYLFGRIGSDQAGIDIFNNVNNVTIWFNPSLLLIKLALSSSYLYLLVYAGSNALLMIITITVFALLFTKLHELVASGRMKTKYVRKELKIKNEFKTLFSLEMKRLTSSKMYLVNSAMGAVMAIFAVVMGILSSKQVLDIPNAKDMYLLIITPASIAVMFLAIGISNPSACSINMEGKTFWLSKVLPINLKKYMLAKLLITMVIFVPGTLIASTIIVIFFHESVIDIVMAYILPILFSFMMANVGLLSNVKHPTLKWKNEQEAVKNAKSVLFTMLWGFLYMTVFAVILVVPTVIVNHYVAYFVTLGFLLVLILIYYIYLNKIFAKKLSEIEDI